MLGCQFCQRENPVIIKSQINGAEQQYCSFLCILRCFRLNQITIAQLWELFGKIRRESQFRCRCANKEASLMFKDIMTFECQNELNDSGLDKHNLQQLDQFIKDFNETSQNMQQQEEIISDDQYEDLSKRFTQQLLNVDASQYYCFNKIQVECVFCLEVANNAFIYQCSHSICINCQAELQYIQDGKSDDCAFCSGFFKCVACSENYVISDDGQQLDCDHYLCHDCLRKYIQSFITDLDKLECPKCQDKISQEILQSNPKLVAIMEQYQMQNYANKQNQKIARCIYCKATNLISIQDTNTSCVSCSRQICANCGYQIPDQCKCGQGFEEFKNIDNLVRCPKCGEGIIVEDGCNFVSCKTNECKGKTYFCKICGDMLEKTGHFDHYTRGGPFGPTCNTTDRL